ncbi:MAG: hypothetical protein KTR31_09150 [Myxococcales bacterium]|nr:hypothetical protein [Myxococcales bacterium]
MRQGWVLGFGLALACSTVAVAEPNEPPGEPLSYAREVGRELFAREWIADDPRSAGGRGLGENANAESCVACHSLGGAGGAGGRSRNVGTVGDLANVFGGMQATMVPQGVLSIGRPWDGSTMGSPRNPPALFGAGLVDAVPETALRALAAREHAAHPAISGRVSETEDGRVGRFAWKGHIASLEDFVAQACKVELDIVVERPGEPEPAADLRAEELTALTQYVAELPEPREVADQPLARRGEAVFTEVGCIACHVESVGPAERVFSDLLLHDMGEALSDAGFGYAESAPSELVAVAQEWRTPPLWGVRDSAPYLHDGRADTLTTAIELHGGEAASVVASWRARSDEDRAALDSFLRSLTAPM